MAEWRRELERRCTAADLDPRVRDEVQSIAPLFPAADVLLDD